MYHNPVLLNECIKGLAIQKDGLYVDVTYGGGGHSREILKCLTKGKLIAYDQDEDALRNKIDAPNLIMVNANFRQLKRYLQLYQMYPVDGILADLGISSHQIDTDERGFTTRTDILLDSRMNRNESGTAADVLNTYSEEQLRSIFKNYGELKNARKIASIIVNTRDKENFKTSTQLKEALSNCTPKPKEHKFFAQVFQALRIEVNDEMEALKEMLFQAAEALKPGGRLVVISYHSLEDRLVKNFIKTGNFKGEPNKDFYGNLIREFKQISKKPITPSEDELALNNRSRSAKLRIAEKT
ncbi:MAG: 16S rRNA (cytosine(1402)-N(4))-methyltransferase RsmH [Bacteroidetes bacterium]|nr:16S rRNA (cytosine(1402)-N(4))-methyltransferase RsmH [Bacteroidota bacterium]